MPLVSGNTSDGSIQLYTGAFGSKVNPAPKIVPKTNMSTELEQMDLSGLNNKMMPTSKLLLFLEAQPHGKRPDVSR